MMNCIECNQELIKCSEDSIYCANQACSRYGFDTAIGKDEAGDVVELRTGEQIGTANPQ
jgi:hypothetical protein